MRSFNDETGIFRPAQEGWDQVVGRHGARVEASVRGALLRAGLQPAGEQVEELVQDFYCRLLDAGSRRLQACRGQSPEELSAYLSRVAERVVFDDLRTRWAEKRGRGRLVQISQLSPAEAERAETTADPRANPEDRMLLAERGAALLESCRRFGGRRHGRRNARIMEMALAGWTSGEISRASGGRPAPATIDKLVHRMKRHLAEEGLALPRRGSGFKLGMLGASL